ncbi:uncharacterized protein (DUF2336 family) [Constrictibacter sp. MBR-5]|jgi:uncharacterized protein (DUF2336 family)|uniref:DUF2336 domain-containing protein n=1 Tax=Constrictibacter sp. MBR-5 TaxID=3156467 RepID=UPI003398A82F
MSEERIDLRALIALAADSSKESRQSLVAVIADLFAERGATLSDRERSLMTEILARLIEDFEREIRRDLAQRFADNPHVPNDLIVMLANDEIIVAEPILRRSSVLRDEELIGIIRHRTVEHQIAIAQRGTVSARVSAALAETANEDVVRVLLENADAEISASTLQFLVEESQRVDSFQEPLLKRQELPVELAKRMYFWVSAALREHVIRNFDIDPAALDDKLEAVVRARAEQQVHRHRTAGQNLASRLAQTGMVDPEMLERTLRQGQVALFETLLARLAALPETRIRAVVLDPSGRMLAIVCRAVDMAKDKFASIYLLMRQAGGTGIRNPTDLSRILKFYDSIDHKDALKVIVLWRRSPDYLNAIERLGA